MDTEPATAERSSEAGGAPAATVRAALSRKAVMWITLLLFALPAAYLAMAGAIALFVEVQP